jgi:putative ABC transport system substrate-binding protein
MISRRRLLVVIAGAFLPGLGIAHAKRQMIGRVEAAEVDALMFESGGLSLEAFWAGLLLEAGLPSITVSESYVTEGVLMTYTSDSVAIYDGMARYVDEILRGAAPADLPFQLPTRFDLRINARTAAALGLTIPEHLRLMDTEIIE